MAMKRSRLYRVVLLGVFLTVWALAGLVPAALVAAAEVPETGESVRAVTLDEAFAIALESSPKIRMARLELEDARLAYEQTRSTALMRPDPIALLQTESAYTLAERNLALVMDQVRLEVAEAFLGVLRVENLMDVVRGSLALAERQLSIAENRFQVGSAARVETIRAANQVSSARANLLELEGSRELALMGFRMAVGLPLGEPVVPKAEELGPVEIDADLEADLLFARHSRLEILRAENAVEVARKQVELTTNDYTPPLARARAELGVARAQEGLAQAVDGIELEIRRIYQSLLDSRRRLDVLAQSIAEAEETLAITEEMYAAGVATDVEVLGAQTALTQAQTDYVNTLFDLHTALVRYAHATARALAPESGSPE